MRDNGAMGAERMVGKRLSDPRGLTIVELLVAMAIAAIVLGIALPGYLQWLPQLRLSSGARQVAADLQLARVKAMTQHSKFRLSFVGGLPATSYIIEKDGGGGYAAESGPFLLPPGIEVHAGSGSVEFKPWGTAYSAAAVTLKNGNGETKTVQVTVVGRVSVL